MCTSSPQSWESSNLRPKWYLAQDIRSIHIYWQELTNDDFQLSLSSIQSEPVLNDFTQVELGLIDDNVPVSPIKSSPCDTHIRIDPYQIKQFDQFIDESKDTDIYNQVVDNIQYENNLFNSLNIQDNELAEAEAEVEAEVNTLSEARTSKQKEIETKYNKAAIVESPLNEPLTTTLNPLLKLQFGAHSRRRTNKSEFSCTNCKVKQTPQWRYFHGIPVCNACYMRARKVFNKQNILKKPKSRVREVLINDYNSSLNLRMNLPNCKDYALPTNNSTINPNHKVMNCKYKTTTSYDNNWMDKINWDY